MDRDKEIENLWRELEVLKLENKELKGELEKIFSDNIVLSKEQNKITNQRLDKEFKWLNGRISWVGAILFGLILILFFVK
jgi:hypothetical protein